MVNKLFEYIFNNFFYLIKFIYIVEQYLEEIKQIMEENKLNNDEIINEDYFEWEIENFNSNSDNIINSSVFYVGGHQWYI